ncbi:hypothetical protein D3C74_216450 [compost metagenome]
MTTRHLTQSIGVSLLALILLSACSSNQPQVASGTESVDSGTVAENNSSEDSTNSSVEQQGPGGMMNEGQMKLMSTFRSLIMLDEQQGLGITKEQAEVILPIVQATVTANELTDDNAASITAELTEDQQAYITKMAEEMPGGGNPGEQGGPGTDSAVAPPEGDGGNPPEGQAPPAGNKGNPADGQARPQGGEGNMEQQLIELLQAKINGTES